MQRQKVSYGFLKNENGGTLSTTCTLETATLTPEDILDVFLLGLCGDCRLSFSPAYPHWKFTMAFDNASFKIEQKPICTVTKTKLAMCQWDVRTRREDRADVRKCQGLTWDWDLDHARCI
ncbi:hypothetical protein H0H87_006918 [Tephrocybe sp. NHM501043]|nr:hypothetical protein H0H87_006918 [Tephrocybe sp. NHM501043]